MDPIFKAYIHRWLRPVFGLWIGSKWKVPVSIALGYVSQLAEIMETEERYVLALVVLLVIDFVSGLFAGAVTHVGITALKMRQTAVKTVTYTLFLSAVIIVSNTYQAVTWLDDWAFFYVIFTELQSITENLAHNDRVIVIWKRIAERIGKDPDKL